MMGPAPSRPILPVASAIATTASQFSTPLDWCSNPRACISIARRDSPIKCAAFSMASGATPLTSPARRGFHGSTDSAVFSNPVVCASMKARSVRPSRMITCSIAISSARSVPGRTGRYRSALRAIGVKRGSATMSLAPLSRARQM